jgi:hypothetical protein
LDRERAKTELESGENQNCGLSTHFSPRIARIRRIIYPIFCEIRGKKKKRQTPGLKMKEQRLKRIDVAGTRYWVFGIARPAESRQMPNT